MKGIIKIILPIFNAYICMFGVVGTYVFLGGTLSDEVNFLFIPILLLTIYGAYIGFKATENL